MFGHLGAEQWAVSNKDLRTPHADGVADTFTAVLQAPDVAAAASTPKQPRDPNGDYNLSLEGGFMSDDHEEVFGEKKLDSLPGVGAEAVDREAKGLLVSFMGDRSKRRRVQWQARERQ